MKIKDTELKEKIATYYEISKNKDCFKYQEDIESILVYGKQEKEDIFISYTIPTYKRPKYLKQAIESILKQKQFFSYEILVIDNSEDFSEENEGLKIVKAFNNPKIQYYINKNNLGDAGNFNRCGILARGKYFVSLHDDDILVDNYSELIIKGIETANKRNKKWAAIASKRTIFHNNEQLADLNKKYNEGYKGLREFGYNEQMYLGDMGPFSRPTCGLLINKEAFIESGGYNKEYWPSFDYVLGKQLLNLGYAIYFSENVLGLYRIADNESLKIETQKQFFICDLCFREYLYSQDVITKIYGFLFRGVQYNGSLDGLYGMFIKDFHSQIKKDDLDFLHKRKNYYFLKFMYKCIRKIYKMLNAKIYMD